MDLAISYWSMLLSGFNPFEDEISVPGHRAACMPLREVGSHSGNLDVPFLQ